MMMVSTGVERKEKKKKNERNLVYLGSCYFGAIFQLLLSCQLGIGCCKSGLLQHVQTKV
jgi:hypothetical protein